MLVYFKAKCVFKIEKCLENIFQLTLDLSAAVGSGWRTEHTTEGIAK